MLTRRNLIIMAAVLVALIAISSLQNRRTDAPSTDVLTAVELVRGDLSRVTIGGGGDDAAVVLENGPDGWFVSSAWNAAASTDRIDALLDAVSGLRGEFRSDKASVVADYGFSDSTTVTVTAHGKDGQAVSALEIGGKPERGQGNFVKLPGSSRVYLTGSNVLGSLGLWSGPGRPESRHFLELQAYRADRGAVDRLTISGAETFGLVKEFAAASDTTGGEPAVDRGSWEWRLEDEAGARVGMAVKTKADGVLSAAVGVRAQDVADPGRGLAAYGLETPDRAVMLTMQDGSEITLAFGDKREAAGTTPGGVYMVNMDDPHTIWVVGEFNVNNIFKTQADLLPAD
jgi:hypothetical protein